MVTLAPQHPVYAAQASQSDASALAMAESLLAR